MIHWLSFSSDSGFRGACMVEADSFEAAIEKTWALDLNPGGEVKGVELEGATPDNVAPYDIDRLYTKAEMEALGGAEKF